MALCGFFVLVSLMMRRPASTSMFLMFFGGLLLGYSVLTKDVFVLLTVAPVVLAVVWRRTLAVRQASAVLIGAAVPYAGYLVVLHTNTLFPDWLWAKTNGVRRFLGFDQTTGFNAEGSPSLVSRLIDQAGTFGTSYILLGGLVRPVQRGLRHLRGAVRLSGDGRRDPQHCHLHHGIM